MFDEQCLIEPPKPIKKTEYYCDKQFHVDSILNLYNPPVTCGLIFINGENCQLFTVDVSNNDKTKCGKVSTFLKQHHKGGSSAARFGRIHDEKVVKYLKDISEEVNNTFNDIDKIVVGGISKRPDQLIQYLHTDVAKKIIGHIVMTQFDDQVVEKMIEMCDKFESEKELKQLKDFTDAIDGKSNIIPIYGEKDINEGLELGTISKLFLCSKLSENRTNDLSISKYQQKCHNSGTEIIEIGISQKSHELCSMFGPVFGISWSYIKY